MSVGRTEGRRRDRRAFRPTLGVGLESRLLLSTLPASYYLSHPKVGVAYATQNPPFRNGTHAKPFPIASVPRGPAVKTEVAHGGQSVIIATPDGSRFKVQLTYYYQPTASGSTTTANSQEPIQNQTVGTVVQPQGTVRAYAMSGGRVGLILDGTTTNTEVTISALPQTQRKGYAHSFAYGQAAESHILNIGQITVNSGQVGAIEGYHTADLSGPLTIDGTDPVDRIAFDALLPGASITTGGDLNTLDILNGVNLTSGPGIIIGRDLNLLNVGSDLDLSGGASLLVNRFMGATPQPPKGTATGSNFLAQNAALAGTGTSTTTASLAAYIQGNVDLGTGGSVLGVGGIPNVPVSTGNIILINGAINETTAGQFVITGASYGFEIGEGTVIARSGIFINGTFSTTP